MKPDLDWMRRFADVAGLNLPDEDLQGILAQIAPLKEGMARIKNEVDLRGIEPPLTFVPRGDDA